jgi:hypothetical protein
MIKKNHLNFVMDYFLNFIVHVSFVTNVLLKKKIMNFIKFHHIFLVIFVPNFTGDTANTMQIVIL